MSNELFKSRGEGLDPPKRKKKIHIMKIISKIIRKELKKIKNLT